MDALTFYEEYRRLCAGRRCSDCPLKNEPCRPPQGENIEKIISIVEKWSKENQKQTNADVFRKTFGFGVHDLWGMEYASMRVWMLKEYINEEKS